MSFPYQHTLRPLWTPARWLIGTKAAALAFFTLFQAPVQDAVVYRGGVARWWSGQPLYELPIQAAGITDYFTYPPFSLLPLSLLFGGQVRVGATVLAVVGLVALFATCLLVLRRLLPENRYVVPIAAVAAVLGTEFEPLTQNFLLGQLNLPLLWLVTADCLTRSPRWPRGILVGIAAAIKLTPAAFILFFLCHRQWRAAALTVASFLTCSAIAWAAAPGSSADFWFRAMVDPNRVGDAAYTPNQSVRGLLARLDLAEATRSLGWILLSAAAVIATMIVVHRGRRAGQDVTAWIAVAVMAALVSPMTWSHHWVWVVPMVLAFAVVAIQSQRWWNCAAVGAIAVCFLIGPHWNFPASPGSPWWHHLLGEGYVLTGVAALAALTVTALRRRPQVAEPASTSLASSAAISCAT